MGLPWILSIESPLLISSKWPNHWYKVLSLSISLFSLEQPEIIRVINDGCDVRFILTKGEMDIIYIVGPDKLTSYTVLKNLLGFFHDCQFKLQPPDISDTVQDYKR